MASDSSVKLIDDGVRAAIDRVRQAMPLGKSAKPLFEQLGRVLKTSTQLRFRNQRGPDGGAWEKSWRARNEGGQTLSLSGRLRRSITYQATNNSVAVGTNVLYAAIHQFGGTIRAKSGPFLSIPITPAARAAGSPRNFGELHVTQSAKGQFLLVDAKGVPQYLLRQQVTMPARPFLGASAADQTELISATERFYDQLWRHK